MLSNKTSSSLDPQTQPKTKLKKPRSKKRKLVYGLLVMAIILLIAGGAYFAGRVYLSLKKVTVDKKTISATGLKGELDLASLKGEGEGRVNILLLGVGDAGHAGEGLTDTMIFASVDPKTKDVVMVSLPRDLWVKIPGYWWSKINAAHGFAEMYKPGSGPEVARAVVSEVLGQPIHYYARVDFSGLRKGVDAINGIDIYNATDLADPEYPCDQNESWSCGFKLKAGFYHMDGNLALKYARCRKGNCGDDFGRASRQQAVTLAMRDQALKLGNILNPVKISELIDIVGGHLKTDLSIEEIKRLAEIAKKVDSNSVKNKVVDGENEGLVKTSTINGASVVIPLYGAGNYSAIRSFVASYLLDGYIKSEAAKIEIQSSGAPASAVLALSTRLNSLGYNVVKTSYAVSATTKTNLLVSSQNNYSYTLKYLSNRLGVQASQQNKQKDQSSDIIIMLGDDYEYKDSN